MATRHAATPPAWFAGILMAGIAAFAAIRDRGIPGRFFGAPEGAGRRTVMPPRGAAQPTRPRARSQGEGAFGAPRAADEPRAAQHARGREAGRGRHATSPWRIPWAGWKDILWRVYQEISADRVLAVAAGVVFYGLLALFPALTALVSSYGLFTEPASINNHLTLLSGILPAGAFEIIQEQITRLTARGGGQLGFGFLFGLGLALWSANAGMKAIMDALNVIYEEEEKRGFFKLNLVSLAFTAGAIVAALVALGAIVVLPIVLNFIGLGGFTETLLRLLRWPALLVLVLFGLALLYRFGPSRAWAQWRWVTPGSLFATVAWLLGSALLTLYLSNFADYDATYGSLGAAIGLMMWMWMSSIVILLGAELNAEIEHQTARDTTVKEGEAPLGQREAVMADTVGEAQA